MNNVILHISYLLGHHDCVVVPGLGAFINTYSPAWIDESTLEFHAPSVSVGFNPEIDYNDWMLADSISRRENISREAALRIVTDEVRTLRYQLETDREVSLGELGALRFNGGATPEYEPASLQPSTSVYAGLPSLNRGGDVEEAVLPDIAADNPEHRAASSTSIIWRVAACIIAIFMGATFLFRPSVSDVPAEMNLAGIKSGLSAYTLVDLIRGENHVTTPLLYIAMPASEETDKASLAVKTIVTPTPAIRLDSSDRYLVIVASFESASQASTYMRQHSWHELGLLVSDDNFRVYAASSSTLSGATEIIDSGILKDDFPQAWVLKK